MESNFNARMQHQLVFLLQITIHTNAHKPNKTQNKFTKLLVSELAFVFFFLPLLQFLFFLDSFFSSLFFNLLVLHS